MELKGSKTEANLLTAFAGESQARTKYTLLCLQGEEGGLQPDFRHVYRDRWQREGARQDLV